MRPVLLGDLSLTVADGSDGRRAEPLPRDRLVMRHGRCSAHRTRPVTRCGRFPPGIDPADTLLDPST